MHFSCDNDFNAEKASSKDFKIGIQNLEKRLQLIYKDGYTFTIDKKERFKVTLKIDLK